MNCKPYLLVLSAAWSALIGTAHAQVAGDWLGRVGVARAAPDVSSGHLSSPSLPGTQADVHAARQLSGGITYMYTDHWAVDLPLALPFRLDLVGDGAIAGVGKIGDVKALPVTVLAQYRFLDPQASVRPYVAAGLTYARLYGERGTGVLTALTQPGGPPTRLSIDSRWGSTFQIGISTRIHDTWFVDASLAKTFLKTRAVLSTGQALNIKFDPVTVSLSVGTRF